MYIYILLAFPVGTQFCRIAGASSKQSSIMHMTLGRVLRPQQLTDAERQAVQQQCTHWTSKLKGHAFTPDVLW